VVLISMEANLVAYVRALCNASGRLSSDDRLSSIAKMDATADGKDEEKVIAGVTRDPTYFFEDSFIVLKVNKSSVFSPLTIISG